MLKKPGLSSPAPPGLYIHIPFCLSRCAYCAFVSSIYDGAIADAYIDALARELSLRFDSLANNPPATLFIGGGTPSCLTRKQLEKLLANIPFPGGGEATCEMNPDSVDEDKLRMLRDRGITRCSFGVQTFSPHGLRLLGRRHDAATAMYKVEMAVGLGFSSVNIDLISAWPGQTTQDLLRDIRIAADLGVRHISCYNLILEEESRFYQVLRAKNLREKNDAEAREFWDIADRMLSELGFEHYETSNFALPGFRCQHNVDAWKGKEYLGLGVAAHSHIGARRFANTADIGEYIEACRSGKLAETYSEQLEPENKARECAVFWLRLVEGVDTREFAERTGYDIFTLYKEVLPDLLSRGVLEHDKGMVRVKKEFHPLLDAVLVDLV